MKQLLIEPVAGCTVQVGSLLSMMELTRASTRALVANLNRPQLNWRLDAQANSVGMLLAHIAAVETLYWLRHLERRDPTPEEDSWITPRKELGQMGFEATRRLQLDDHFRDLARVRRQTVAGLRHLDDEVLNAPFEWRGVRVNLHRQFFHVMEDELRHCGQIRFLLKRLVQDP